MMKTLKQMEQKLQKADRKQAVLYLFCNFISLMLITAYGAMMTSPTVQTIFPPGGDSRKQMYAIFVLALFGCVVFTIYAAGLFFRKKSRQLGILMALGASRKRLAPGLFREVLLLSSVSSLAGILAGFPFLLALWNLFRIVMFDTAEMVFTIDFRCLFISAALFLLVVVCVCVFAVLYLKRTNILDVIQEEHKNEPVKEPGLWCGPVGIVLLVGGAVLGYESGGIYQAIFHKYSSAWLNLTYAPVFIGLYMIMLHTVVHGWSRRKKNPYKNIFSRSMMKFQGRQTVRTLLVSTVLIAGGCFGIFYIPTLVSGLNQGLNARAFDYAYHYPPGQGLSADEVQALAAEHQFSIKDWREAPFSILAADGMEYIEEEDRTFHYEYASILTDARFLSESSYNLLTGENVDVSPGKYCGVTTLDGVNTYAPSPDHKVFTNLSTMETLPIEFQDYLYFELMADRISTYVLDDGDYRQITQGLNSSWTETLVYFNADGKDSYAFASDLYHAFVNSFHEDYALAYCYDRTQIFRHEELGGAPYFEGAEEELYVDLENPDSSNFRMFWAYMPKFRILETNDTLQTYAVFFMVFIFIAIICFTAAVVIGYTRCQTIVLNNRYIFDDLKRLGAPPAFLSREIRRQCCIVYRLPALIGMSAMLFFILLILYSNDGILSQAEIIGFVLCLGILVLIAAGIYAVYLRTVYRLYRSICRGER